MRAGILEQLWLSLLSSPGYRHFARGSVGSAFFRSPAYRKLGLGKNYLASYYQYLRRPGLFQDVQTFCLFIGHNKSGTSLLGALLDAHPQAILADEVTVLNYVAAGFRREQIFHILLKGSRRELLKGRVTARRLTPYSYLVPGQWQGRFSTLRVIGDGASGSATRLLARNPDLRGQLQAVMGKVAVKFVQVIRNPYDPIGVSMVRGGRSFENALAQYAANCHALVALRHSLSKEQLLAVRYEEFVQQPALHLSHLCRYLGLEPAGPYLADCVRIVHPQPAQDRHRVTWQPHWIEAVQKMIEQYDFLEGYSFDQ